MPDEMIEDARSLRARLIAFNRRQEARAVNQVDGDDDLAAPVRELFKVLVAIDRETVDKEGKRNASEATRLLQELRSRLN